uniref:5'3' exoribonuclease 1 putative n=1 Tax=Albugo laibachii Nc14 TaxID=890382 RepID=F0WFS2_9STRA|nr:5'3' exoribonuclease 1 putative [Albugo laibachii Nc14]|eukprot:CCA20056.1 5'3' exoribonuclease 1 putative [Albugo laibachii Nc14]
MGIPRFYAYISERYPLINQTISGLSLLPEFDCFYLDMNGILHVCTHNNNSSDDASPATFEEQFQAIVRYLDRLVTCIVKPRKLVYLAIDGVAPRAKLNQQRSRRFSAGLVRQEKVKELALEMEKNGTTCEKDLFDSSCITPGTEFLERISEQLVYFIRHKIKNDPLWSRLEVYFSGSEVPGEGEHKIMDFIRQRKMSARYDANVRHCMYGSDADLMLLSLMAHEPHFTLIREHVDWGSGGFKSKGKLSGSEKKKIQEDQWQLVHLSLFREYLMMEMRVKYPLGGQVQIDERLDGERMIDDFIFLTFLFGNDFIPHSPTLEIRENAIPILLKVYRELLDEQKSVQYLTDSGKLVNVELLQALFLKIGSMEEEILSKRAEVERKKRNRKHYRSDKRPAIPDEIDTKCMPQLPVVDELDEDEAAEIEFALALDQEAEFDSQDEYEDDVSELLTLSGTESFQDTKWTYYERKFGLQRGDGDAGNSDLQEIRKHFLEALVWCLAYYFQGPPSWSWYYPHHYSPMISDLTGIADILKEITFPSVSETGAVDGPLLPFEQLLANLPSSSAHLLPKPFQFLMQSPLSPIKHFYPATFQVDMEGKRNDWEGVTVLPFIDIEQLRAAILEHCPMDQLTEAECKRNRLQLHALKIVHDSKALETVKSSLHGKSGFPDIAPCHSRVEKYSAASIQATKLFHGSYQSRLLPGVKLPLPGFPSLYTTLTHSCRVECVSINCFGFPSRKETLVVQVDNSAGISVPSDQLLGCNLNVNWPHLHEALVVGVSTAMEEYRSIKQGKNGAEMIQKIDYDANGRKEWARYAHAEGIKYLKGRGIPGTGGIDLGEVTKCVHVRLLEGIVRDSNGSVRKVFGKDEAVLPFQLLVLQESMPKDIRFQEIGPLTIDEQFPITSRVLITAGKWIGCLGIVRDYENAKVKVEVNEIDREPPFGYNIASQLCDQYISGHEAANRLGISKSTLGILTGSLFVMDMELGLKLHSYREHILPGYCRLVEMSSHPGRNAHPRHKKQSQEDVASVWRTGDTIKILGSTKSTKNKPNDKDRDLGGPRSFWEYSERAMTLLSEYVSKFASFVRTIEQLDPSQMRRASHKLFGTRDEALAQKYASEIASWVESKKVNLQYAPVDSQHVSLEAMQAIEAAGSARRAERERHFSTKSQNPIHLLPRAHLFVPNSHCNQDVTGVEVSKQASANRGSPVIGDRVVNICAREVPMGYRGTVVATFVSTKCVEVLFDESFIGGESLYGTKSMDRGKIVPWNNLLCVSKPSESHRPLHLDTWKKAHSRESKNIDSGNLSRKEFDPSKKAQEFVPGIPASVHVPEPTHFPDPEKMTRLLPKTQHKEPKRAGKLLTPPENGGRGLNSSAPIWKPSKALASFGRAGSHRSKPNIAIGNGTSDPPAPIDESPSGESVRPEPSEAFRCYQGISDDFVQVHRPSLNAPIAQPTLKAIGNRGLDANGKRQVAKKSPGKSPAHNVWVAKGSQVHDGTQSTSKVKENHMLLCPAQLSKKVIEKRPE